MSERCINRSANNKKMLRQARKNGFRAKGGATIGNGMGTIRGSQIGSVMEKKLRLALVRLYEIQICIS